MNEFAMIEEALDAKTRLHGKPRIWTKTKKKRKPTITQNNGQEPTPTLTSRKPRSEQPTSEINHVAYSLLFRFSLIFPYQLFIRRRFLGILLSFQVNSQIN